jgi:hypothetical protein
MFALLEVSDLGYDRRSESVPQALAVSMITFAIGGTTPGSAAEEQMMRWTKLRCAVFTQLLIDPCWSVPLLVGTIRYR